MCIVTWPFRYITASTPQLSYELLRSDIQGITSIVHDD